MTRARFLVVAAVLVGWPAPMPLDAGDAVTMSVQPRILIARGDIHVEARVPRRADNRSLTIAWDSEGGTAGSTWRAIDGEAGPVLHTLWLAGQPAVRYRFTAVLRNTRDKIVGVARADVLAPDRDGGTR